MKRVSERLNSRARVCNCVVEIESSDSGLCFRSDLTIVLRPKDNSRCKVHFVLNMYWNDAE